MLPLVQRHPSSKATGLPAQYVPGMQDEEKTADAGDTAPQAAHGPGHDAAPEPGMTSAYLSVFRLFYRG